MEICLPINVSDNCEPVNHQAKLIWVSLKCVIAGVCIEYSVRKRKAKWCKAKLMDDIEKVEIQIRVSVRKVGCVFEKKNRF